MAITFNPRAVAYIITCCRYAMFCADQNGAVIKLKLLSQKTTPVYPSWTAWSINNSLDCTAVGLVM